MIKYGKNNNIVVNWIIKALQEVYPEHHWDSKKLESVRKKGHQRWLRVMLSRLFPDESIFFIHFCLFFILVLYFSFSYDFFRNIWWIWPSDNTILRFQRADAIWYFHPGFKTCSRISLFSILLLTIFSFFQ